MMEASSGRITIDGVDIHDVGLGLLRRRISVISQDAVLFAGTLRYNLDPFGEHDDLDLWNALKQARLVNAQEEAASSSSSEAAETIVEDKDVAKEADKGPQRLQLDMTIAEEGSNLSQGQRALISIARALVKRSKIVILDEATASVDSATDGRIQTMLQDVLRPCTVLTVAHRLDTVVGPSDVVCVMDQGQVAECDEPTKLFAKEGGLFRQLCESAGIDEHDIVRARDAVQSRTATSNEA